MPPAAASPPGIWASTAGLCTCTGGGLRAWYFHDAGSHVWNPAGDGIGIDGGLIADGLWHHVALVVDHAGGRLYVDGMETGALPWTGTPGAPTTAVPLLIGQYPGQSSFAGDVDALTIWNRALTPAELAEAIRAAPGIDSADLVSLWHFDEPGGDRVRSATSPAHDGTLSGSVERPLSTAPVYRP